MCVFFPVCRDFVGITTTQWKAKDLSLPLVTHNLLIIQAENVRNLKIRGKSLFDHTTIVSNDIHSKDDTIVPKIANNSCSDNQF